MKKTRSTTSERQENQTQAAADIRSRSLNSSNNQVGRAEMIVQQKMLADIHGSPKMIAQRLSIQSLHNSPRMAAQRKQAKQNSARTNHALPQISTNLTKPVTAVQRVIKLDGADVDNAQLLAEAADMAEKIIIANWDWSQTVHNFTKNDKQNLSAKQKLLNAIQRAKNQVRTVPALFSAANLKFLTQAEDRLPTLYFVQGTNSGRLRQQHGSGPAVFTEVNKIDYFFASKSKMRKFKTAAKLAMTNREDFNPDLSAYEATTIPTAGYAHFETTYSGRKLIKIHPSGGAVVTGLDAYTDLKIKAIYQGIIGLTT